MPGFLSELKPTALFTAVGMGCGGLVGSFFGAPLAGAQIVGAMALKVGLANKAEKVADDVGKKVSEGADAVGRKIELIVDRTNEKLVAIVERVADTWATIMLCGYTWNISTSAFTANRLAMNTVCDSFYASPSCFFMEMNTISIASISIAASFTLGLKLREMYQNRNASNKV